MCFRGDKSGLAFIGYDCVHSFHVQEYNARIRICQGFYNRSYNPNEYNDLVETFGQWVVKERVRRGLSQNKLAKEMGYSQAALSRIEADKVEPTNDLLKELARVFGVTFEEVLRHANVLPKISEQDEWLRRVEHKLSKVTDESDRRIVEGLIDMLSPNHKRPRENRRYTEK